MIAPRRGPAPQSPDDWLLLYARRGDVGGIRHALELGATALDEALIVAARRGRTLAVEYLLDRGANPDREHAEALCWAAFRGHAATARAIARRASQRSLDTALILAAESYPTILRERLEAATTLLDAGANPNASIDIPYVPRPMEYYRDRSKWADGENLPTTGSAPVGHWNRRLQHCDSAVLRAASCGSIRMLQLLLERGAELHECAILFAIQANCPKTVAWILERRPDEAMRPGETLRYAHRNTEIIRLLLDAGHRPTEAAFEGLCLNGNLEGLDAILPHLPEPQRLSLWHVLPCIRRLHFAPRDTSQPYEDRATLMGLLARAKEEPGAVVAMASFTRGEALAEDRHNQAAAMLELIAFVHDKGADIHVPHVESDGLTALARTAWLDDLELARLLISLGADIHADGEAALRAAWHWEREPLATLLLEAGADPDRAREPRPGYPPEPSSAAFQCTRYLRPAEDPMLHSGVTIERMGEAEEGEVDDQTPPELAADEGEDGDIHPYGLQVYD